MLALPKRQLIEIAQSKTVPDIEVRVSVFPLRMSGPAVTVVVLGSKVGVRSLVERMAPGVRGQKREPLEKRFSARTCSELYSELAVELNRLIAALMAGMGRLEAKSAPGTALGATWLPFKNA